MQGIMQIDDLSSCGNSNLFPELAVRHWGGYTVEGTRE